MSYLQFFLVRPADGARWTRIVTWLSTGHRVAVTLAVLIILLASEHAFSAGDDTRMRKLLVVGDSISAAYGMDIEQGWVAQLAERLERGYPSWRVVNASISGDTTGGGLRRLPRLLAQHEPQIVVIELGGNDGLRGFPIKTLRANLTAMTEQAQQTGAEVLLLSMEIPPNLGARYAQLFRESFTKVARRTDATLAPFVLEGIATNASLMQADGIHPTAAAQIRLLDNIWPHIEPMLAGQARD